MGEALNPKVTVLMPAYNGEKYLREAIDSILSQTFRDFEFLIINDGSTDATVEIINSYTDHRVRLVHNDANLGLIATLNKGLDMARGEFVARQDADDISHPTRLEKQISFMDSHPEVVLLGTQVHYIDQYGKKYNSYGEYKARGELAIRWQLIFDNPFAHSSVMMRTGIVRDIGGYDEHFLACEDYDLWSRLVYAHSADNLKEALLYYRCHPSSMTANCSKENNLLVGGILRRTCNSYINFDPSEELIDLWLSVNNPYNFNSSVNAQKLIHYIEFIYSKFILIYPIAQSDAEIKKHMTHMMMQISYNMALTDRFASIYCFCHAFKRDIPLVCRFFLKYLAALILGRHRKFVSNEFRKYCGIIGIR